MLTTSYLQSKKLERGNHLADYTLLEVIGRGGEAEIWSAWDNQRSRVVALKVAAYSEEFGGVNSLLDEFEKQAHLIASLEHPHILPLYRFGAVEGYAYFAMRYSCMGSLASLLQQGPLSIKDTLVIAAQMTSALSFLHMRGIVHRDLKPDNVLLDSQRFIYLSDFGLARELGGETNILHTGRGTEAYAPFEQHNRLGLTPQSDIYSFGIMIYEMLMGKLPWRGTESLASHQYQGDYDLPDLSEINPDIPPAFMQAIRRLTAFHWTERPSTVLEAYDLVAKALMPRGAPPTVSIHPLERPDEEKLVLGDAHHLLRLFLETWQPEVQEFPARLTHLAYIDAAFTMEQAQVLTYLPHWQQFMLRGALVYDYRLAHWQQVVGDERVQAAVYGQTVRLEEETAVSRAIILWLQNEKTEAALSSEVSSRLIELAVSASSWALRQDALKLLIRQSPVADKWQPVSLSADDDKKVAQLILSDKGSAQGAVQLLGQIKSEQAVQEILTASEDETSTIKILADIRQYAGNLPANVPAGLRFRIWLTLLYKQLLEDREGISLARSMIGLAVGLLVSLMMLVGIFTPLNNQTRDVLLEPYPVSNIVTIVAVDDASLAQYGRWDSWPRSLHAQLIERLQAAGAKAIVFDILFEAETDDDQSLAEVMQEAGNVVQPILGIGDAFHEEGVMLYKEDARPNALLAASSAAVGHANVLNDRDGVVRQIPTVARFEGDNGRYPSLAMAALAVFVGSESSLPDAAENGEISVLGRTVPVAESGEMFIHYAGPPASLEETTFTTVSYHDVIEGNAPAGLFEDKLVLVGITAAGEPDRYLTAVGGGRHMYGVEILANAVETIWSGNFIRPAGLFIRVLILLGLGVITGLICTRPWTGLLLAAFLALIYLFLASLVFDATGILLDIFFPVLTIALSYAMVTAYRYSVEVRRRRQVMALLERRVAPEVAQAAIAGVQKGELDLKGRMQMATILAVDLRGYNRFLTQYNPEDVMAMIAHFRELATQIILDEGGMMVNTQGQQVTAVFNAPLPQPNHSWLAVSAAYRLLEEMKAYHASFSTHDHPHRSLHFGCGIVTGQILVGYGVSGGNQAYMAVGEVVDTASQLAHMCLSDQVLMGESTWNKVSDQINAVKPISISVRDKTEPILVYKADPFYTETIDLLPLSE